MRIGDLARPVTTAKSDWLPGDTWIGFTPTGVGPGATAQCQSTVNRKLADGYLLEYITEQIVDPNPGHENSPEFLKQKEVHKGKAGRLVAVHRLRTTARPLIDIIGEADFRSVQDMWSKERSRNRWSVAFPIIEKFEVIDAPRARDVFGENRYREIFQRSTATLRVLSDEDRLAINDLEINRCEQDNAWIAIEDDFIKAERSDVSARTLNLLERDFALGAMEGESDERRAKVLRRAAWLAEQFISERSRKGALRCERCSFDPMNILDITPRRPRSLLDVHHLKPLEEGRRFTTVADFALLCPTCHRVEHERLRQSKLLA
ncbi:MAG TPA: HNH endonuclease [Caulobacterales bacterium]|nr:HNH endonuclease [Caulobacterales bacterium]